MTESEGRKRGEGKEGEGVKEGNEGGEAGKGK